MDIVIPFSGSFRAQSDRDRENARAIVHFINENTAAFCRSLLQGHVTASACVVSEDGRQLLMTHHNRLDRWLQLGGHCDGLRDPFFVAQKEAYEESGLTRIIPASADILDVDIHRIPSHGGVPEHWHYDVRYEFVADEYEQTKLSRESKALKWVPLAELEAFTNDKSLFEIRQKLIGRRASN
jgi:8-oxo-dGTP pyrophosphatase MutT (NUDIX family)